MSNKEFISELRSRVNPQYEDCIGTESHERKQCADALEAADKRIAELTAERDALKKDADRWGTMSGLMFLGNVFAEQDVDGGYKITLDPAENLLGVSWEGNSPEEAIDQAKEQG